MSDSVHEFEELWAEDGGNKVSSDVDQEDGHKVVEVQPEASDNSEATSKSTDDPQHDTPSTRQHGMMGFDERVW